MTPVTFPKISQVEPLGDKKLRVIFENGQAKIYDCNPLLTSTPFAALQDDTIFRKARADDHGFAVIWSDELDLAESEIWLNGQSIVQ
jgi:hypothetical protein